MTLPHLCCCFSRERFLFSCTWLAWEGGSESASLLANLAQAVETQRFLRNVSDCDSTGPAQRHVFIMYGWRNYLSPGGHVSLCISFSPLPSSPFLCPLSLSLSFWGSLPTPWPPPIHSSALPISVSIHLLCHVPVSLSSLLNLPLAVQESLFCFCLPFV